MRRVLILLMSLLLAGVGGCAAVAVGPDDVIIVTQSHTTVAGPQSRTDVTVTRDRAVFETTRFTPGTPTPSPSRSVRALTPAERERIEREASRAFGQLPERRQPACTDTGAVSITIESGGRRQSRSVDDCGDAGRPVHDLVATIRG